VTHPAEYMQEKVKRGGISCLLLPHCCTPAWVISPECYVLKTVLKRDARDEIVNTYTCKNYSVTAKGAFKKWLGNLVSPAAAIGFSLITGGVDQVFKAYLVAAAAAATPLPSNIATEMSALVRSVPFTQLLDLRFPDRAAGASSRGCCLTRAGAASRSACDAPSR
jgi:hypothetical protein